MFQSDTSNQYEHTNQILKYYLWRLLYSNLLAIFILVRIISSKSFQIAVPRREADRPLTTQSGKNERIIYVRFFRKLIEFL